MSLSNRKVMIALLSTVSLFAAARAGWFYYDFSRAKKAAAADEAERLRKAEAFVKGLLERQDAPQPTHDGQFPCVLVSVAGSSASPQLGKCSAPGEGSGVVDRFEVDLRYGNFVVRQTDLFLNDLFDVPLTRSYNSGDYIHPNRSHAFGNNTNHPFDVSPLGNRNPYTYQLLVFEDGNYLFFGRISEGTSSSNAVYQHTETSTRFYKAVTAWNGNGWTTFLADGTKMDFPEAYNSMNMAQGALVAVRDAQGNKLELLRDDARNLTEIRTTHGRSIKFQYDDRSRISLAKDDRGQWTRYQYSGDGMLTDVLSSSGRERHYRYEGLLMTRVEDERHNTLVRNSYDGRTLVQQDFGNGQIVSYNYTAVSGGPYADSVVVTMPDGKRTELETASSVPEFLKHPPN